MILRFNDFYQNFNDAAKFLDERLNKAAMEKTG
jgi:hypothetical protein